MKKIILFVIVVAAITMSITCRDELLASVHDRKNKTDETEMQPTAELSRTDSSTVNDSTTTEETLHPIGFTVIVEPFNEQDSDSII